MCLLHLLTLIMTVIQIVTVIRRTRTVMMSGGQGTMLMQGFRGVQLYMYAMGKVKMLLEVVLCLISRLLLHNRLLLSCLVGMQ